MSHRPQDSFSRPGNTYPPLRDQFQRENVLNQERNYLNVQRPSNAYFPSYRNIEGSPQSKATQQNYSKLSSNPFDPSKKTEIKHKIKEIIDLCRDENAAVTRDIHGVMQSEKGIYNLLQQTDIDQTRLPPDTHQQVAPSPLTYTPVRSHQEPTHPGAALQRDIRAMIEQNRHLNLSEEALQLIYQIEKRSLAEIDKLVSQKLSVTAQLNEQLRRNNAQKKRTAQLQRELDFYRKNQGTGAGDPRFENELRSRILYLQNLLQSQQGVKSSDLPDFNVLFAQGQAIRQETLRLLKLKEAKVQGDDIEKRRLREEVERLQRKVEQLQQQRAGGRRKTSYQTINEEYSPIATSHKRKDSYRNSANEYQSLVMEMRKITSN